MFFTLNKFTKCEIRGFAPTMSIGFKYLITNSSNLSMVTNLRLENSQLTSLPSEIGALTGLKVLDLGGNRLTPLPSEIGALTGLMILGLHENKLTSFPSEIGALTGLTRLDLRRNRLT